MDAQDDEKAGGSGLGDDQGTRVGGPDRGRVSPAKHEDGPSPRPEKRTGVGGEATEGSDKTAADHTQEHRSGYGGSGGKPVRPSDERE